jgi:(2Fe-2S) ferredoxin
VTAGPTPGSRGGAVEGVADSGAAGSAAPFRCSAASREQAESVEGTASTVRAFLLVEAAGPWGVDAVRDSRLPDPVKRRLRELESTHRVRPLLVRRHRGTTAVRSDGSAGRLGGGAGTRGGGAAAGSTRVFAAYVHTDRPWAETVSLGDVRDLLDLDLSGLGEGRSPGLAPHDEPLFLVCTHGRHDACCAERGRPLAGAMAAVAPGHTWEVSHIGGDRFAANLLVLPHGLYYGRLTPQDAPAFVESHLTGSLDVEHLRGRSSYPFSVQAAEIYLRRHLRLDGIAPLPVEEHARHGTETRAVFGIEGRRWEVRVLTEPGDERQLTCRATTPSVGFSHRLVGLADL